MLAFFSGMFALRLWYRICDWSCHLPSSRISLISFYFYGKARHQQLINEEIGFSMFFYKKKKEKKMFCAFMKTSNTEFGNPMLCSALFPIDTYYILDTVSVHSTYNTVCIWYSLGVWPIFPHKRRKTWGQKKTNNAFSLSTLATLHTIYKRKKRHSPICITWNTYGAFNGTYPCSTKLPFTFVPCYNGCWPWTRTFTSNFISSISY